MAFQPPVATGKLKGRAVTRGMARCAKVAIRLYLRHGFGRFSEITKFGCRRKSLQIMQIKVDVHVDVSIVFFA